MDRRSLVRLLQMNETTAESGLFTIDPLWSGRLGISSRRHIYTSQTAGDDSSGHNLHDMGFRRLYTAAYYLRPTG